MKCFIKQMVIARTPELEIDSTEFEALRTARRTLIDAFALEEKWEIVVFNYQELERELLMSAVEHAIRDVRGYEDLFTLNAPLTPRMVNLLTAARLYLDQAPQHLAEEKTDPLRAAYESERAKHYDECFEYRFMEALRNYVQHRGIPVHMVTHGGSWVNHPDGTRQLEFSTVMQAKKKNLAEDTSFKRKVLNEMPESVDLLSAARSYVERLSQVHGFIRGRLAEAADAARKRIEDAQAAYLRLPDAAGVGLEAICRGESGGVTERVPLLLDWDNVRLALQNRNPVLTNLSKRHVTSRATR